MRDFWTQPRSDTLIRVHCTQRTKQFTPRDDAPVHVPSLHSSRLNVCNYGLQEDCFEDNWRTKGTLNTNHRWTGMSCFHVCDTEMAKPHSWCSQLCGEGLHPHSWYSQSRDDVSKPCLWCSHSWYVMFAGEVADGHAWKEGEIPNTRDLCLHSASTTRGTIAAIGYNTAPGESELTRLKPSRSTTCTTDHGTRRSPGTMPAPPTSGSGCSAGCPTRSSSRPRWCRP